MENKYQNVIASSLAYSFGYNRHGELGLNDKAEHLCPTLLEFCLGKDIVDVACGRQHTALLTANGKIYTCGGNDNGQCGVGSTNSVPTLTLVSSLAEKGIHIERIFSGNGSSHLAAVTTTGKLYMVGNNSHGQLGIGNTTMMSEFTVVNELLWVAGVTDVACSYYHSIITANDGNLYACGQNNYGQLGIPDSVDCYVPKLIPFFNTKRVLMVSCGECHTIVSLESGGLMAFGKNSFGQLGIGTTASASTPTSVIFQPNQTAKSVISQIKSKCDLEPRHSLQQQDEKPGETNKAISCKSRLIFFPKVACGNNYSVAISDEGAVYAFGHNGFGQLGLGHNRNMLYADILLVLSLENIVDVACGCHHTALTSDEGNVFVFGRNTYGQLGLNSKLDCCKPISIPSMQDRRIQKVATGKWHSICFVENSTSQNTRRNFHGSQPLIHDLRHMLNNPNRSDVTFVVDGKKIFAHSFLLSARCEPMEKMLDGRMCDGSLPEIDIPDYSYNVFLDFMEYLYTSNVEFLTSAIWSRGDSHKEPEKMSGKVEDKMEYILELLKLADQYLVSSLKKICKNAILRLMSVENICILLQHAHFCCDFEWKNRCIGFILLHYTEVIATEDFLALPQEILREVLHIASKRLTVTL